MTSDAKHIESNEINTQMKKSKQIKMKIIISNEK